MQLIGSSSTSSSSSSSSSHSSSSSAGERPSIEQIQGIQHLRLHSPAPPHGFKVGKKHRHGHDHRRHHPPPSPSSPLHAGNEHRHHSPAPPDLRSHHCCEKGKLLRVKPPKPSKKKVRKLHHKLMKACKLPKGARGAHHHRTPPPAAEPGFYSAHAPFAQPPGCCLHYHAMSTADHERLAEEQRPPHEVGVSHHGHLRRHRAHSHPHPRNRHPCAKPEIRSGTAALLFPSHEAAATPAEPPMGARAPPSFSATMLLTD